MRGAGAGSGADPLHSPHPTVPPHHVHIGVARFVLDSRRAQPFPPANRHRHRAFRGPPCPSAPWQEHVTRNANAAPKRRPPGAPLGCDGSLRRLAIDPPEICEQLVRSDGASVEHRSRLSCVA
jgi:hypothetical protein